MIAIFYRNPEIVRTPAYGVLERRLTEAGIEFCGVCICGGAEALPGTAEGRHSVGNPSVGNPSCGNPLGGNPSDGNPSCGNSSGMKLPGGRLPELIVSLGGDGTFLSSARFAAPLGIPVLGTNAGRLGFLSENRPEDVAEALVSGDYRIEESPVLSASVSPSDGSGSASVSSHGGGSASASSPCGGGQASFLALNEISVHRLGPAMLGVDAAINGNLLPTYWADGLIVATALGSTAYSLSAGGPIAFPGSGVLLVTPISPHNLNVRPLIIPETSQVELRFRSRDPKLVLSADNVNFVMRGDSVVRAGVAQFSLKRARLRDSGFINALTSRLYWGEDVRNH